MDTSNTLPMRKRRSWGGCNCKSHCNTTNSPLDRQREKRAWKREASEYTDRKLTARMSAHAHIGD